MTVPLLKITIVMPRTGEWPSGGTRVCYDHANQLAGRGHTVTVVAPGRLVIDPTPLDHLTNVARYTLRKIDGRHTPASWHPMNPRVRFVCVPSLSERFVPDADVVIATAWQTVEWVSKYSSAKGRKFYFIQHLETWNGPESRVYATWKAPLQKIVISKWLGEIAKDLGESAVYIPNGLDIDGFPLVVPSEERNPRQLMMLYHTAAWKGSADGIKALSLLREQEPDICVDIFGVPVRPKGLPEWMQYHHLPSPQSLRELYNRAAIFVAPSWTEGWGLPPCEALLSGAAVVATDVDGHREFAFHENTALTSPPKSPGALAENALRLIRDSALRIKLAENGRRFVRQFTWERASASLEATLSMPALKYQEQAEKVAG